MWFSTLLLLLSAILHAIWNTLIKRAYSPRAGGLGILGVATFFALGFALLGGFHLPPHLHSFYWTVFSGIFEGGYFLTLAIALEKAPLGVTYLITRGGAMLGIWGISFLYLNEPVTPATFIGVVLVLAGLGTVHQISRSVWSGLHWAYFCAVCIAGYHLCYGRALETGIAPAVLFAFSLSVALPVYAVFCGQKVRVEAWSEFRKGPGLMLMGGFLCWLSFLIFLYGLTGSGAGFAITLRNSSVVFVQILSVMTGEKISKRQWLGASLVAAGVLVVSCF